MFTKYPGKLFLMGEFAIMEKGSVAVISPVNHYLHITVEAADDFEIISSHGHLRGKDVFEKKMMPHVQASLNVLDDLVEFKPFKLTIHSDLEINGKKVGFGSSGVVIVAVLDSLLRFHDVLLSKIQLFKLACLVQLRMDEFSSGGDLAACIYRDTVVYHTYDREWLLEQDFDTKKLIDVVWPNLDIRPLKIDDLFTLEIGWTGEPHSTNVSLQVMKHKITEDPEFYKTWVTKANIITKTFVEAIQNDDFESVTNAVSKYRNHMLEVQRWLGIAIETKALSDLIESTQYPAKVSGSGGGDCGIVFVPHSQPLDFIGKWESLHIKYIKGGTHYEY